jgi:hypothetical protein
MTATITTSRSTRKPESGLRTSVRILIGCIGIGLIVIGLAVMSIEISRSSSLGEWRATTLLDVVRSPYGQALLPDFLTFWLAGPRTFKALRDIVVWGLEFTPVWLGSMIVGGAVLWKALRN